MTKGDVLTKLSNQLEFFTIPEFICFTVDEWKKIRLI